MASGTDGSTWSWGAPPDEDSFGNSAGFGDGGGGEDGVYAEDELQSRWQKKDAVIFLVDFTAPMDLRLSRAGAEAEAAAAADDDGEDGAEGAARETALQLALRCTRRTLTRRIIAHDSDLVAGPLRHRGEAERRRSPVGAHQQHGFFARAVGAGRSV